MRARWTAASCRRTAAQLRYVIVDGCLVPSLSSPLQGSDGLYIGPLRDAPSDAASELVRPGWTFLTAWNVELGLCQNWSVSCRLCTLVKHKHECDVREMAA